MPHVRVIVAAYQQLPFLKLTMRGYLRQTSRDFSLVIADDGSSDGTQAFLEAFACEAAAAGIAFEHHGQEDRGFRKTRILNTCIREAGDEQLFLFSDGDCIPPAAFVERHIQTHEPYSFHVGGAIRLSEEHSASLGPDDVDQGSFESMITEVDRADLRKRARKSRWGTLLRRKNRPKVLGLNMAFDRALLEGLNGFDERFEGYGYEDSDLRDRAMRHRPRPVVKVHYGWNDVFHLWHPRIAGGRAPNREYYAMKRSVFCERGLRPPDPVG